MIATLAWLRRLPAAGLLGVVCVLLGVVAGPPAYAAKSKPCFRNTGDTKVQIALLHRHSWGGGWTVNGWYNLDPHMDVAGRCIVVAPDGFASEIYYLAVIQQDGGGKWSHSAFDVTQTRWEEKGLDTVGGTFTLENRSTMESVQTKGAWGILPEVGGVRLLLCVPKRGSRQYQSLANQQECNDGELLALFGTKLYMPTDGGMLATNTYHINIRAKVGATVFNLVTRRKPDTPPKSNETPATGVGYGSLGMDHALRTGLLLYGKGDRKAARWYLSIAAHLQDPRTYFLLGRIELAEDKPDLRHAEAMFTAAANRGHAEAQYELAILLDKQSKEGSLDWLKKAAAAGSVKASQRLKALGQ